MLQPSRDPVHRRVHSVAELLANRHPFATNLVFKHDEGTTCARSAKVIGAYVAALPPEAAASEPNPWILVLKTGEQTTIAVELKQTDALGNMVVCCSDGPRVLETGELEGCARSWALAVQGENVVGDWIDRLVETGLTRYRLDGGLGSRWWMDCVLSEMRGFLKWHCKTGDLRVWIRLGWDVDGTPTYPGMMQTLHGGRWLEME